MARSRKNRWRKQKAQQQTDELNKKNHPDAPHREIRKGRTNKETARKEPHRRLPCRPLRITPRIDENTLVLVDVQNLFHSSIHIHDGKVKYPEMLRHLVAGRAITKAIAYCVATEENKERTFFNALRYAGFEVRERPLQIYKEQGGVIRKKGDWDVGMTVDAIKYGLKMSVDTVILVSGDGDFVELVEFLQENGIKVEVASFRESTSANLIKASDKFTNLSENPEQFILRRPE